MEFRSRNESGWPVGAVPLDLGSREEIASFHCEREAWLAHDPGGRDDGTDNRRLEDHGDTRMRLHEIAAVQGLRENIPAGLQRIEAGEDNVDELGLAERSAARYVYLFKRLTAVFGA